MFLNSYDSNNNGETNVLCHLGNKDNIHNNISCVSLGFPLVGLNPVQNLNVQLIDPRTGLLYTDAAVSASGTGDTSSWVMTLLLYRRQS